MNGPSRRVKEDFHVPIRLGSTPEPMEPASSLRCAAVVSGPAAGTLCNGKRNAADPECIDPPQLSHRRRVDVPPPGKGRGGLLAFGRFPLLVRRHPYSERLPLPAGRKRLSAKACLLYSGDLSAGRGVGSESPGKGVSFLSGSLHGRSDHTGVGLAVRGYSRGAGAAFFLRPGHRL